ncbi:MAG: hypothetical protein AAEJ57_08315 [Opitutales bacterium]
MGKSAASGNMATRSGVHRQGVGGQCEIGLNGVGCGGQCPGGNRTGIVHQSGGVDHRDGVAHPGMIAAVVVYGSGCVFVHADANRSICDA